MGKRPKESELEKTARTIRYLIYGIGIAFLGLLLLATFSLVEEWYTQSTIPALKIGVPVLKILKIKNVSAEYDSYGSTIDEVKISMRNITIKNIGNGSFKHGIILEVALTGVKRSVEYPISIKPNGTYSLPDAYLDKLSLTIDRYPGEYRYTGTLYLKNTTGEILDKANISVLIPTAKIGDTILIHMRDGRKFDLTLNSWHIEPNEDNTIDVVVNLTVKNSYSRTEEDVPSLDGVIMTEKGYVYGYQTSHFYCPTSDNPYRACPSSLLPEESFTGELRIEGMPKDWKPVELSIFCLYGDVKEVIILGD